MNYFSRFKLVIFDLDNTLINEEDYLFEGYKNIANYLSKKYKINNSLIEFALVENFRLNGRTNLFNKIFDEFKIGIEELNVVLRILREFKPENKIHLITELRIILERLKSLNISYVILTNGNPTQQKNKIAHINWGDLLPHVIYANEIEPKPSEASFKKYLLSLDKEFDKDNILMIGDSNVDKLFAKNFGCKFSFVSNFLD
jgi:putative hydrolase of the HAD superfamily